MEHDKDVAHLDAHRIGGDFRPSGLRDDGVDLLGERLLQHAFERARLQGRLVDRDRREPPDLQRDGALVELGNELGPQRGGGQRTAHEEQGCGATVARRWGL